MFIARRYLDKAAVVVMAATIIVFAASMLYRPALAATPPTVTAVNSTNGSTAGGDTVTITGTNFLSGDSVTFDGVSASNVTVVNSTTITATTPAGVAGTSDVRVTHTTAESGMLVGGFVYVDTTHTINTWTGATSTDWATATNWSKEEVPSADDIVVVNGSTRHPLINLDTTLSIYSMQIGVSAMSIVTVANGSEAHQLSFANDLAISRNGQLTHAANTTTQTNRLFVQSAGDVSIGGRVNLNAKGYSNASGPGGGTSAAHAGHAIGNAKAPYGSIRQPVDLGSGGSTGAGGGAVKIAATNVTIDGSITADGSNSSSGGSVWVNATNLTGNGTITANAVANYVSAGRVAIHASNSTFTGIIQAKASTGSSGTIYTKLDGQSNGDLTIDNDGTNTGMYCAQEMDSTATYDNLKATGGGSYCIPSGHETTVVGNVQNAAASPVHQNGKLQLNGRLIVRDNTTLINYYVYLNNPNGYSDQNPVVGNGTVIEPSFTNTTPGGAAWQLNTLTIMNGGNVTHPANTATQAYALNIDARTSINLQSGGKIDLIRKGYTASNGPGGGAYAAHAGYVYNGTKAPYGSIRQPIDLGSGGSTGVGGGAVKLTAPTITVNGIITTDGYQYSAPGSVWLNATTTLNGSGTINANAVSSYVSAGRIALYAGNNAYTGTVQARASGLAPAGTIYTKTGNQANGELSIDNGTRGSQNYCTPEMSTNATYDGIEVTRGGRYCVPSGTEITTGNFKPAAGTSSYSGTIENNGVIHASGAHLVNYTMYQKGVYEDLNPIIGSGTTFEDSTMNATTPWNLQTLTVKNGGTLTTPDNVATHAYSTNINASGLISVESGGTISADGRGYSGGNGPGKGTATHAGGGYGGQGLPIDAGGGLTYGDRYQPIDLGSSGGGTSGAAGGGAIKLTSDSAIQINGTLTASGVKGVSGAYGGGSGGSVWLTAGSFTGTGKINANGGDSYSGATYAGGGGRIALTYSSPLSLTAITPNRGGMAGGDSLTLSGSGFSNTPTIMFGTNKVTSLNYINGTTLNVSAPAAASIGPVDVSVTQPAFGGTLSAVAGSSGAQAGTIEAAQGSQTATLANGYTYVLSPPTISAVSPASGSATGGNSVTITGNQYQPDTKVFFGPTEATVTYVDTSHLTATAPAGSGTVDVRVQNADGQEAVLTSAYTYNQAPTITSVIPGGGSTAGGNNVTITGTNFLAGSAVKFGNRAATNVTVLNTTTITATVPSVASVQKVDVSVTLSDGQSATLPDAYSYNAAPAVSSVTPNSGPVTGGNEVTITGANFLATPSVEFDGQTATNVTFVSITQLKATVPAHVAGSVSVTLTNPDGQATTRANGYAYQGDATITGADRRQGPMTGNTFVTISGTNFDSTTKVFFDNTEATVSGRAGTTAITVRTPAHAPADVDIRVQTNINSVSLANAYRYLPDAYAFTYAPTLLHGAESGQLTIQARSASNTAAVVPYDLTLDLASSSVGGSFSADGITWGATTLVIPAGQSSVNLYYKDGTPGSPTLTATGPDGTKATRSLTIISQYLLLVTGVSSPINARVPSAVTIPATDGRGPIVTDYTGTIQFSSSDVFASLPADFTITPEMNGRYTFVNGISMLTQGEQCVTATDTSYSEVTGSLCNIQVEPGFAGSPAKLAVITDPQTAPRGTPTQPITLQMQNESSEPVAAPNDFTVYIAVNSSSGQLSTDGTTWQATSQLTAVFKKGTSSINIYYQDSSAGTRTLTFKDQTGTTDTGLTDTSQQVAIGVGPPTTFGLGIASSVPSASWRALTVTLRDQYDQVATNRSSSPINFTVNSTGAGVQFSTRSDGSSPAASLSGSFGTGSSTRMVYIKSPAAQIVTITASDVSTSLTDASANVTFIASEPAQLSLSSQAAMAAGEIVPVTISLTDGNGELATNTVDTSVSLAMRAGSVGEFSRQSAPFSPVSSVVIPQGETSITVYFRSNTANTQTLEVKAVLSGREVSTVQSIVVSPADFTVFSFAGSPATAPVSEAAELYLQTTDLYGNVLPMMADTVAYLSSTSPSGAFAIATSGPWNVTDITIPSGSSTSSLFYRDTTFGVRATLIASDTDPIDSPDTGITNAQHVIDVVGQAIGGVRFTSSVQSIKAGEVSSAITIRAVKADGSVAIVGQDTDVSLTSSSSGSRKFIAIADASAPATTKATIPAGQSEVTVYYTDMRAGTAILTATLGGSSTQQSITIQANGASRYVVTSPTQTITQNDPSEAIHIQLTDAYENPVTAAVSDTIILTSSCATGAFATSTNPWQQVTELTYPSGNSSGVAAYFKSGEVGDCDLTFASNTYSPAMQSVHVAQGAFKLALIVVPDALVTGESTQLRVELQDKFGNIATRIESTQLWLSTTGGSLSRSTVTIAAGASSAEVTLTAPLAPGSLTASVRDEQSGNDTGLVNANRDIRIEEGAVSSVAFQPTSVSTSAGTPIAVTIGARNRANVPTTTTAHIALQLSTTMNGYFTASSDPSAPAVTQTTILTGQKSVTVYYRQSGAGTATITASSATYGNATGTVTVSPLQIKGYRFVSPKTNLEAGEPRSYQIEAYDQYGNTAIIPAGYVVYVSSTGHGVISGTGYNTTTHALSPSLATKQLNFTYRSSEPETSSLIVSDVYPVDSPDTGASNARVDITVTWGAPTQLHSLRAGLGGLVRGDNGGPVTFQLMNAHGTVVPAPVDMSVTIRSSSLSGEFADTVNGPWSKSQVQRTIGVGQTSVSLSYRDNSQLGTFTISASSPGLQAGGINGTITAGEPTQIVFKSTPQTTYATHTSLPIVIEAQNQFGQATPFTSKRVLQVSSSSSTGSFAQTLPAWDTFRIEWPAGANAIQYYYRDYQAGTHTLSAEMDNLRTPNSSQTTSQTITQPFTVTPQVLDRFIVTNISTPQSTNNNTSVVVIAIDAKGSVVANYDGTVRFITSDPEGKVPQPYTFQPYVDRGSRTFVNAVSFRTPGVHTVTVIDDDNGVLGAQTNIQVIGAMPDNSTTDEGSGESTSRSPDSQGSPNDHDSETNPRSPHAGSSRPPRQPSNESPPQSVASGFSSPISSLLQRFGIDKNLGSRAPLCLIALTMILALVGWSMRTELRHISFLLTIQRRLRQLQNEAQAKQLQVSYAYVVKGVTTATRIRPYYLRLPCYIPVVIALILSLALMHAINRSTLPSTMLFLVLFTIALAYSLLRTRWVKATDRKAAYKLDLEESYLRRQPIAPQGSAQ